MITIRIVLLFCITIFSISLKAQIFKTKDNNHEIIENINENLNYLSKENIYISSIFKIEDKGIAVLDNDELEFYLYYNEIPYFLNLCKYLDMYELREFYESKGTKHIQNLEFTNIKNNKIKIAIDPGHFASNQEEAIFEDRYVKYKFDSAKEDTYINEAVLNYDIAYILKDMLIDSGYEVMISREKDESALGINFDNWMENGAYINDMRMLVDNNEFTLGKASILLEKQDRELLFDEAYYFLDFKERVKAMNKFNADISLIIHLNASEDSKRDQEGYSTLTTDNYYMAFVPGSFLLGELEKVDQRIDFLRLLVGNNISKSIHLSESIAKSIENNLGVSPFNQDIIFSDMIQYYTVSTMKKGIYARNLYMTRAVQSPLSYLEVLVQNNREELIKLATKDFDYKGKRISSRIYEIAKTLHDGIIAYQLDQN